MLLKIWTIIVLITVVIFCFFVVYSSYQKEKEIEYLNSELKIYVKWLENSDEIVEVWQRNCTCGNEPDGVYRRHDYPQCLVRQ